jgi:hypothetical protein
MLEVSSIGIAVMMLTLVGIVAAGLDQLDSFNDRTDGQFRRLATGGGCQSVPQGQAKTAPPFFFRKRLFEERHDRTWGVAGERSSMGGLSCPQGSYLLVEGLLWQAIYMIRCPRVTSIRPSPMLLTTARARSRSQSNPTTLEFCRRPFARSSAWRCTVVSVRARPITERQSARR